MPNNRYTNSSLSQTPVTGPFGFPLKNSDGSDNEIRVARKGGRYTLAIKSDNAWRYFDESLKAATASELGTIKVGSGLAVTQDGVLSATGGGGSGDITGVDLTGGTGISIDSETNTTSGAYSSTITCNLEGTELVSTGETGTAKFLRVDGDGTCSWQTPAYVANTDVDVSIANLKTRLAGGFGSNAVTIGDSDDVVTIGGNLAVTGTVPTWNQSTTGNAATATTATTATNVTVAAESTDTTCFPLFALASSGNQPPKANTNFSFNSSTAVLTASGFAGNATSATTVTVTDNENTDEENLITFVAGAATATGVHGLEMDGNVTYNPSTGKITATGFTGTASKVTVTDSTANTAFAAVFHDGSDALLDDTGTYTYNPSSGLLSAPSVTSSSTITTHILKLDSSAGCRIYAAANISSTTPSVGVAGQAIVSNAAGTPYWGYPTAGASGSEGHVQLSSDVGALTSTSHFAFGVLDASPLVLTYTGNMNITGAFEVKNGSTSAGYINFYEDSSNGTNKVTLIGPASTADITLTLPSAAGTIIGTGNSTSITTLGTITTGTWTSSTAVIASAYLDADTAHLSTTQTFSGAKTFSANLTMAANLVITGYKITANTSAGAGAGVGTAGNALLSYGAGGGVYWGTPTSGPAGSTEHVQYNASGAMAGEANFKWEYAENNLAIDGTVGVTGAVTWASGGSANANTAYTHSQVSGGVHATDWSTLALGSSSSTAYRGDRGTTAYNHSQASHAPSGAEANVSGNSGNAAVYDNGGTPTLKSGITATEMRTAIGAGTSSLAIGTSGGTALEGDTAYSTLALGTSSSTAHRGDYGTTAYNYSQVGHLPLAGGTTSGAVTVQTAASGATAATDSDEFVIQGSAHTGMSILGGSAHSLTISWGDSEDNNIGYINYDNSSNAFNFATNTTLALTLDSSQNATFAGSIKTGEYGLQVYKNATHFLVMRATLTDKSEILYDDGDTFSIGTAAEFDGTSYSPKLTLDSSGNATFAGNVKINGGTHTADKFGVASNTTGGDGSSGGHFTNTSSSGYQGRAVYAVCESGLSLGMGIYCASSGATTNWAIYAGAGNVYVTNNVYAAIDVVAYYSSDPTLKENKELISNPLDKINNIGGYSFDWKESAEEYAPHLKGHDYGVMADEIADVLPELVQTRENGIRAVKYDKLVPLLIEGIKELKQQLDTLKGIA